MIDPRNITFRIVQDTPLSSEDMEAAPAYSIYGDFPCGPMWMGQFPSMKTAKQFRWAFRHAPSLLSALKQSMAIIQGEKDKGMWFDEKELDYLQSVIDYAEIEGVSESEVKE